MNKYTVPTILLATILVAGIFVLMPVEKASTVHTTIIAATDAIISQEVTVDANPTDTVATEAGVTIQDFDVSDAFAIEITGTVEAATGAAVNDDLQILVTSSDGLKTIIATTTVVTDTLNAGTPFAIDLTFADLPPGTIDITLTVIDAAEAGAVTATVDIDIIKKVIT